MMQRNPPSLEPCKARAALDKSVPVIGWVALGGEALRGFGHDLRTQVAAVDAAMSLMKDKAAQEQLQVLLTSSDIDAEIDELTRSSQGASVMDTLWKLQVVDIEATLRSVCAAVLSTPGPREVYRRRAKALRKLGTIFQAAKKKYSRATSIRKPVGPE